MRFSQCDDGSRLLKDSFRNFYVSYMFWEFHSTQFLSRLFEIEKCVWNLLMIIFLKHKADLSNNELCWGPYVHSSFHSKWVWKTYLVWCHFHYKEGRRKTGWDFLRHIYILYFENTESIQPCTSEKINILIFENILAFKKIKKYHYIMCLNDIQLWILTPEHTEQVRVNKVDSCIFWNCSQPPGQKKSHQVVRQQF